MDIDYKNTLNLPSTKFSMRANLPCIEVQILKSWYKDNLYSLIRLKKNKKKIFLLHDGPPYANGKIHLGHAVNKILKDIILKYKGLSGYNAPYIPGWDCHGLPIELQVEKSIHKDNIVVNDLEFRNICRKYAIQQVQIQKEDFIRLGVLGDWENSYLTMNFITQANIIRTLSKIISQGYVYKGIKPVYWCLKCHSTVANSEVVYKKDHISSAVYIGFFITDNIKINNIFNTHLYQQNIELVIWTTTLWTVPANQAVSVHPDYVYQLVKIVNNKYIIIASELLNFFMEYVQCYSWEILGETVGSTLEYLRVKHPFMHYDVPVILSKHITLDFGTGIVHIAPNHGIDDFVVFQKYGFKICTNIVDDEGYYLSSIHEKLNKLHIFESNKIIIDLLCQSKNFLYVNNYYQHIYPYCSRHRAPLIFRATAQWFINMDYNNLRDKLLLVSEKVDWFPKKGLFNMKKMILNRPDWCLSRQRTWGIPIPIFINKKTKKFHPNTLLFIEKIAKLVEVYGIQIWWDLKIEDILLDREEINNYEKAQDILDVWFDSGSTYNSVVLKNFEYSDIKLPSVDLYIEGVDQYRGWFMSSLIISGIINGCAPYKKVLSHGFVIDSKGNKMSKSIGNIISPKDIIDKFGSDILRLWIASSDYTKDMAISDNILKRVTDIYRRIRNTIRFFLANISDFNPKLNIILPSNMLAIDRWAIDHALSIQCKIISSYDNYQFHNVIKYVMKFCSIEMGSFYLDVIKDRQYTLKRDSVARRSCQTTLYHISEAIVRWIAPILSFTADDIWKYIPGDRSKYVFTEEWYDGLFKLDENQIMNHADWKFFFDIRSKVNKVLEQARISGIIRSSLEASIFLYAIPELAIKLRVLADELAFGLIVSSVVVLDYKDFSTVDIQNYGDISGLKIVLKKSHGIKCLRCWHYSSNIINYKNYLDICSRCIKNIEGIGEDRKFF